MDAVKFLEEYSRMCNAYNDCVGCPMHDKPFCHPHDMTTNREQRKLVDAVERWSCEHSIVTNEMNDTISRADAIYAIVNTVSDVGLHDNSETARYGATFRQHEIITILKSLPSADRPKGEWIPYLPEGLRYKCSECESRYDTPWHFCPNCGADMRGEDNE